MKRDKYILYSIIVFFISACMFMLVYILRDMDSDSDIHIESDFSTNSYNDAHQVLYFDLNEVTFDELLLLEVINEKIAANIISYRDEIGLFSDIDELLNVEEIGEVRFNRLKPYLFVNSGTPTNTGEISELYIDLNSADLQTLIKLPYIGEAKANAIIEYRTRNSRFYSKSELLNISGIGQSLFEKISPFVYVENEEFSQSSQVATPKETQKTSESSTSVIIENIFPIDINKATVNELMLLNGIGEKKAKEIVEYRTKISFFYAKSEIMNVNGIGEAIYHKIKNDIYVDISYLPEKQTSVTTQKTDNTTTFSTTTSFVRKRVNINNCTSEDLQKRLGIDSDLADKIIEFREYIGGAYVNTLELLYIEGMTPLVYEDLREFVYV